MKEAYALYYKMKHLFWELCLHFSEKLYRNMTVTGRIPISYAGRKTLFENEYDQWIAERIRSGQPFMIARLGAVELQLCRVFDWSLNKRKPSALQQGQLCAGIFPAEEKNGRNFVHVYKESLSRADAVATWRIEGETYYIRKYMKRDIVTFQISALAVWFHEKPWTEALNGKKVLIIHPLADTISRQYEKRETLFFNSGVLPKFELKVLKAVQTAAGQKDERFHSWFEALEYMGHQIEQIDFDIALLGCGAYGIPLAARIKDMGKQAVYMGGILQILFGIKGKRWVNNPTYKKLFNEEWVYPDEKDIPVKADQVEQGAYW